MNSSGSSNLSPSSGFIRYWLWSLYWNTSLGALRERPSYKHRLSWSSPQITGVGKGWTGNTGPTLHSCWLQRALTLWVSTFSKWGWSREGVEQRRWTGLSFRAGFALHQTKPLRSQSFSLLTRYDNVICQLDWAVEWPLVKNCPGCFWEGVLGIRVCVC